MPASDITVDIDRSSTPFPRSRRSERTHEKVEDYNRRLPSPVRFSDTSRPTMTRGRHSNSSPIRARSPPRYRSPVRTTSSSRPRSPGPSPSRYRSSSRNPRSTSRLGRAPSPRYREVREVEEYRSRTRYPPSSSRAYVEVGSTYYRSPSADNRYASSSEYVRRPVTPPRAPVSRTRPSESYSSSSRYGSYVSGTTTEYVSVRSSTRSKSRDRRGDLSPRIIESSYRDSDAYRGDYTRRY
ncbi:hypothetical protein QBC40DRAFT_327153 [Triangularia verruculosa]|uniref:Uncharacterized protein n=1 Tax=Triangularia verruculosa TaxID=2587418 RepID=A0AAN6XKE4_9PEZI|nr:hypothetical protein QBC40DRAFT_327153 [Triangularia verruculosa]